MFLKFVLIFFLRTHGFKSGHNVLSVSTGSKTKRLHCKVTLQPIWTLHGEKSIPKIVILNTQFVVSNFINICSRFWDLIFLRVESFQRKFFNPVTTTLSRPASSYFNFFCQGPCYGHKATSVSHQCPLFHPHSPFQCVPSSPPFGPAPRDPLGCLYRSNKRPPHSSLGVEMSCSLAIFQTLI